MSLCCKMNSVLHIVHASRSNYVSRFSVATLAKLPNQLRPVAPAPLSFKHPRRGILPSLSHRTCSIVAFDVNKVAVPSGGYLGRSTIADAVAKVIPAVVHLEVFDRHNTYKSCGAGIIIDEDGTIVTCAHVVNFLDSQGRKFDGKVYATLSSNEPSRYKVMVVKEDSDLDVAFLKIHPKRPLPKAKLGCSNDLRPGDWVVSIGSSYSLPNSVTLGIVSYLNRTSDDLKKKGVYLQTDCAFNEGNSGGPLLNLDGEVVGVNKMKDSKAESISFATTIDSISTVIDEFKQSRMASKPYLGFTMFDLCKKIHPEEIPNVEVEEGGLACLSGIQSGDYITQCGNERVSSANEVNGILENTKWPVEIHVKRQKKVFVRLIGDPVKKDVLHHGSPL